MSGYEKYEPFFSVWTIRREIGAGSFGRVFEVERKELGVTYTSALKIISIPQNKNEIKDAVSEGMTKADVTAYYRGLVKNVVKEIELMTRLKGNSNIVSYEDHQIIEHEDGIGCDIVIRMELLTPLKDYINSHKFTERDAVKMGIDVCQALELCEKKNIVHRDIKPENIFISENGDYKLGDFGIARVAENTISDSSQKGTYTYMAPEVYKGMEYGAEVDLYSFGLVLYRIFNNYRMPFFPEYPNPVNYMDKKTALKKRISGEKMQAPANARKDIARTVLKACAYDRKSRYSSAEELKRELEKFLRNADDEKDLLLVYREVIGAWGQQEDSEEKTAAEENHDYIQNEMEPLGSKPEAEEAETELIETILSEKQEGAPGKKKKILAVCLILLVTAAAACGFYFYKNIKIQVPDFLGMTREEAQEQAKESGLILLEKETYSKTVEKGKIISQSIPEGEKAERKSKVSVVISLGKEYTQMGDFTGMTRKKAEKEAQNAGITLKITEEYSDEVEKGKVIEQKTEAGEEIEKGSMVILIVSKGAQQVTVPDFTGKSQGEVVNACKNLGMEPSFIWEYSDETEQGYALKQDIAPGTKLPKGNAVMITLSKGKDETKSAAEGGTGSSYQAPSVQDIPAQMPAEQPAQLPEQPIEQPDQNPPENSAEQEQDDLEEALNDME